MSGEHFLIHAIAFDSRGQGTRLDWEQARQWQPGQNYLWLHLDYTQPQTRQWLRDSSGLDPLVVEALLSEETRPRATKIGDGLLINLRGVNLNPGADPEDMVSIRIWIDRDRMISTRKRLLLSVQDLATQFAEGEGPDSPGALLTALSTRLIARMQTVIDRIDEQIVELEELLLEEKAEVKPRLADLRRELIALRRYLAPQREALQALQQAPVLWLQESHRLKLREVNDRLTRYLEDLNEARERSSLVYEELLSQTSERMNQRMYVLSIIAAIFLPLGFLTGLLGVNVGGIPGSDNPYAFALVSSLLLGVVVLQYQLFRRRHWL